MEFEQALTEWARTVPAIVTLIGEANRLRLYKLKGQQAQRQPSIVIQRGGAGRQYRSCGRDGAVQITLQVDHYAKDWQGMAALAKTWRAALEAASYPFWMAGSPDDSPPGAGVKVKSATCDNEFDLEDPDPGLVRRSQSWTFWVFEA